MSTMDVSYKSNNYLIYIVKNNNKLYLVMETSMIEGNSIVTTVVTLVYKK